MKLIFTHEYGYGIKDFPNLKSVNKKSEDVPDKDVPSPKGATMAKKDKELSLDFGDSQGATSRVLRDLVNSDETNQTGE